MTAWFRANIGIERFPDWRKSVDELCDVRSPRTGFCYMRLPETCK